MRLTTPIVAMSGLIAAGQAAPLAIREPNYQCFRGSWESYPPPSQWVSLETMFENAHHALRTGCLKPEEPQNTDEQVNMLFNAVRKVGATSGMDERFIFATVMQESNGCVNVHGTPNPAANGPFNPGLMQSHSGTSFIGNGASPEQQFASIEQMLRDGTQGTPSGDGLVQCAGRFGGHLYEAARCYNSGENGVDIYNLNNGGVATASYVNDIANRLLGWVWGQGSFGQC